MPYDCLDQYDNLLCARGVVRPHQGKMAFRSSRISNLSYSKQSGKYQ
jgi:hypothetical protein